MYVWIERLFWCNPVCRFGKPLVINMMEVDLFESVQNQLDQVNPGLSEQLMNKELLQEERYSTKRLLPAHRSSQYEPFSVVVRFSLHLSGDVRHKKMQGCALSLRDWYQGMSSLGRYLSLVRSTDGPQYARTEFMLDRIEKFSLVLVTKQRHPPDALLTAFYPIHVMLPEPKIWPCCGSKV